MLSRQKIICCFILMTTNNKGFIALVSALIIGAILASVLLSSSLPVFQYRQTIDQKIRAVVGWEKTQEVEDESLFHSFN